MGFILAGVFRGLLVAIIVLAISLCFNSIQILHPISAIFIAFITTVIFATAGLINGIFAKKFDDVAVVPTFVLTPLTYLGGVFYSIDMLPNYLRMITMCNPIFYLVNGLRFCFFGYSDINLQTAVTASIIIAMLMLSITHYLLKIGYRIKN